MRSRKSTGKGSATAHGGATDSGVGQLTEKRGRTPAGGGKGIDRRGKGNATPATGRGATDGGAKMERLGVSDDGKGERIHPSKGVPSIV